MHRRCACSWGSAGCSLRLLLGLCIMSQLDAQAREAHQVHPPQAHVTPTPTCGAFSLTWPFPHSHRQREPPQASGHLHSLNIPGVTLPPLGVGSLGGQGHVGGDSRGPQSVGGGDLTGPCDVALQDSHGHSFAQCLLSADKRPGTVRVKHQQRTELVVRG